VDFFLTSFQIFWRQPNQMSIEEQNKTLYHEERWNTITHLLGVIFALVAFPFLFTDLNNMDNPTIISLIIYAFSFVFLFSASTIYHFVKDEKKKILWRKIDHISIYFMISGTYVPFMIRYIEFEKAIIFLSIIYSLVFIGSILKIWFTGKFEKASLFLYIFLGWMILFIGKSFYQAADTLVISSVVAGGIVYLAGVYFYVKDERKYYHAIWHIFVLLGSILHFQGVIIA
jgi:hemolysin III